MVNDPQKYAINRIEAALARIEAVSIKSIPSTSAYIEVAQLKARHDALRNETKAALTDIDRLIADAQAGQSGG
jgi:hypothetical protein